MGYLGTKPANAVLTSDQIGDGVITTADLANGAVTDAKIAAMAASKLTGQVPAGNAVSGSVIQVVSTTKTDTFSTTSTSYVDITGLSATITPSSSSSRIIVIFDYAFSVNNFGYGQLFRVLRNSTTVYAGNSAGSRPQASQNFDGNGVYLPYSTTRVPTIFVDSPATTSAITYKLQCSTNNGSYGVFINRTQQDRDTSAYDARVASSVTLMEIAA